MKALWLRCKSRIKKSVYKSFTNLVLTVYTVFAVLLLVLLLFVLLGLYLSLRNTTEDEIKKTLSKQADDNMLALSSQEQAALWQHFFQYRELLRMTSEMVASMQNEDTFALKVVGSVTVEESCRSSPCSSKFAYKTQGNFDQNWLDRTSRLESTVRLMVDNQLIPAGLSVHFLDWGFSRHMPGSLGLGLDSQAESQWISEWNDRMHINHTYVSTVVSSPDFSLDPPQACLMQDLVLGGVSKGFLCARLTVESDIRHASQELLYLGKGIVFTIYRNGVAIRDDLSHTTVSSLGLASEWELIQGNPYSYSNTTHKVVYEGELYRVAAHPVGDTLNEESLNWWFVTVLLVKEADILDLTSYDYETDMGLWMMLYPMLAALVILIAGAVFNWMLNDRKLRTPMNRIKEAMTAMKEGDKERASGILKTLGKDLQKSEVQRLVLGMLRLISEVSKQEETSAENQGNLD